MSRGAVDFFERQFGAQVAAAEYALNPFERDILPFLRGEVLELGCGLGNLALAAAARGCRVTALDASPTAIADLARRASDRGLQTLAAEAAELRDYAPTREYDGVVAIGLLMFFACPDALALLGRLRAAVRPGGVAALNVLVEGTTWLEPFGDRPYCLFERETLSRELAGWQIALSRHEDFSAPGGTRKRFHTLVAQRPVLGQERSISTSKPPSGRGDPAYE